MFVLDRNAFRGAEIERIVPFVLCWERFYKERSKATEEIRYLDELNLGQSLTEDNLRHLLQWKDPVFLGKKGPHVPKVLARKDAINAYRAGALSDDDFWKCTCEVFGGGFVWRLFLFHVALPAEWPIADQHVFRSYKVLFSAHEPRKLDDFRAYTRQFMTMAKPLRAGFSIDDDDLSQVVAANKRLDNALMSFGQFLKKYDDSKMWAGHRRDSQSPLASSPSAARPPED